MGGGNQYWQSTRTEGDNCNAGGDGGGGDDDGDDGGDNGDSDWERNSGWGFVVVANMGIVVEIVMMIVVMMQWC